MSFGAKSPLRVEHLARVERKFGIDTDKTGIETDYPAPIKDKYGVGSYHEVRSRDKLDAEYAKASRVQVEENLSLGSTSGDIILNAGTGFAVEFSKLKAKFDALVTAVNSALGSKTDGGGTPGAITVNIDDSKVDHVRL